MEAVIFTLKKEIERAKKRILEIENRIVEFWHKEKQVNYYRGVLKRQEKFLEDLLKAIEILNGATVSEVREC